MIFPGSFDSSVHVAEESSNAAVAVPWGIVNAISVAGILGWGMRFIPLRDRFGTANFYVAINMVLAFCMGSDLEALWDSDQPMALIFLNSFGRKATLGVWIVVVLVQYMMGSSMVRASDLFQQLLIDVLRLSFSAPAVKPLPSVVMVVRLVSLSDDIYCVVNVHHPIALPFSGWLYRISNWTQTPINAVWYDAILAIAMGLLVFAGDQAINAAFALSVTGLYVAYAIPIVARFWGGCEFTPGPFYLGVLVSTFVIL